MGGKRRSRGSSNLDQKKFGRRPQKRREINSRGGQVLAVAVRTDMAYAYMALWAFFSLAIPYALSLVGVANYVAGPMMATMVIALLTAMAVTEMGESRQKVWNFIVRLVTQTAPTLRVAGNDIVDFGQSVMGALIALYRMVVSRREQVILLVLAVAIIVVPRLLYGLGVPAGWVTIVSALLFVVTMGTLAWAVSTFVGEKRARLEAAAMAAEESNEGAVKVEEHGPDTPDVPAGNALQAFRDTVGVAWERSGLADSRLCMDRKTLVAAGALILALAGIVVPNIAYLHWGLPLGLACGIMVVAVFGALAIFIALDLNRN